MEPTNVSLVEWFFLIAGAAVWIWFTKWDMKTSEVMSTWGIRERIKIFRDSRGYFVPWRGYAVMVIFLVLYVLAAIYHSTTGALVVAAIGSLAHFAAAQINTKKTWDVINASNQPRIGS